jgi:hypothetical protein
MVFSTEPQSGVHRVTVALDPEDVELLDRLARMEGLNRSAELRSILRELRPVLKSTVEAFEAALAQRDLLSSAAAQATLTELTAIQPEVEEMGRRYLGIMSQLEGAAAVAADGEAPASNTGATNE